MVTFRPVRDGDLPLVRELAHRIWHEHYPGIITREQIDYMLARGYEAETIRNELAAGYLWEIVLCQHDAIGFLSSSLIEEGCVTYLHKLYLLPAWHGRGLGRQMLARVEDQARRRGTEAIRLRVNKRNTRAIRAYERAGFHVTQTIVDDIGGGFVMDDYVMTRSLA